jgi:hypothetical protein
MDWCKQRGWIGGGYQLVFTYSEVLTSNKILSYK